MKRIYLFILILVSLSAGAQLPGYFSPIASPYDYQWLRTRYLRLPLSNTGAEAGAIRYNPSDSAAYVYTGYNWVKLGAGASVDSFTYATRARLYKALDSLKSTITLQTITDAGWTTTHFITVDHLRVKPTYTSDWVASLSYSGNGASAYGVLNLRDNSTGGGYIASLSPTIGLTDNRYFTLPNKSGTLALVEDLAAGGGGGSYTLPPATTTTLGGVKIGAGIAVATDGTITGQPQVKVNSENVTYSAPRINFIGAGGVTVSANNTTTDVEVTITGGGGPTITTQATSTTLTTSYETWVFTGSSAATFTLPASGTRYVIKSRGTGTLTVSGTIYTNAAKSSITILNGDSVTLQWDGSYWVIL